MNKSGILAAGIAVCFSAPSFAQFGGMFQGVLENAAKQAVQQGAQQGVQQGVVQAVTGAPAQPAVATAPIVQNGCYFNLPVMPPGTQFNADLNGNGCVEANEFATYMQVYQSSMASAAQRQQAAPATNNAVGAALGSAVAVRNAGGTGNAAAWVAGQNALGAAVSAARAQPAPTQVAAANPADFNGDGVVTAEEIAAYQARVAAANGVAAPAPAQGVQGTVSNATSEVVSGAVSGALKGLFGH